MINFTNYTFNYLNNLIKVNNSQSISQNIINYNTLLQKKRNNNNIMYLPENNNFDLSYKNNLN